VLETQTSQSDAIRAMMPHAYDRTAVCGELSGLTGDGVSRSVVESGVGLVEQQDARSGKQRTKQCDSGDLPDGEPGGIPVERHLDAEASESTAESFVSRRGRAVSHAERPR